MLYSNNRGDKMANIRDVAKASGHSVSTVSRVLNQKGYVSEQTKSEILSAMEKLNYHRNDLARALSLGKSYRIGVILPYINHPYFQKLADAIAEKALMENYQVTLLPTNYDSKYEMKYLDMLKHRAFDGLIFTSRAISFSQIIKYRNFGGLVCCEDTFDYPLSCAFTDRKKSFGNVLRILKDAGYSHIGLTVSRSEVVSQSAKLTTQSYESVFGHAIPEGMLYRDAKNMYDGITAAGKLVETDPDLEVIFANGDQIAAGALKKLEEIDHQALVIGQENLASSFLLDFSTVDHRLDSIGETAFDLLFEDKIIKKEIPSRFIVRGELSEIIPNEDEDPLDKIIDK